MATPLQAPVLPEVPLKVREVAQLLRVTEPTVRQWLRDGRIKGIKLEGNPQHRWRIPRAEVDRLLAGA